LIDLNTEVCLKIAKSKKQSVTEKKPKKQLSIEDKFQLEWQRVQELQKSNARLRLHVVEFFQAVSRKIGADEKKFCSATVEQTERLIKFIPRKSLSEYKRREIITWVQSNIEDLLRNPFSEQEDVMGLTEQFSANIDVYQCNQFEKWHKKNGYINEADELGDPEQELDDGSEAAEASASEEHKRFTQDMFEDLFAQFGGDDVDDDDAFANFTQHGFEEKFSHFDELTEKQREESNALSKILKSTSISKLFRRVAKVLHPDLVQDDAVKEEKHNLMAELIAARENKDIIKIIAMYTEHVGEAPLDLFDGNYEKMTILLKYQVERLEQEKSKIIAEDPAHAAIYLRFHNDSAVKVNNKLRKHLKELDSQTRYVTEITSELTSLKKIDPILEKMYYRNSFF